MLKKLTYKGKAKPAVWERTADLHICYDNCKYTACDITTPLFDIMASLNV